MLPIKSVGVTILGSPKLGLRILNRSVQKYLRDTVPARMLNNRKQETSHKKNQAVKDGSGTDKMIG